MRPYLIAFVIGLIVGIEREKSDPNPKTMGVRTFLMISLLGALAGAVEIIWLSVLIAAFVLALIVISYFNQTRSAETEVDRGLTTEFAAGIIFCLGYVAHQSPTLAAVLGPIVAVILFSKKKLHRFTHHIKPAELEAALFIILAGVIILDFIPDKPIDPWQVFNPRQFGYLILILAILEFSSYVLTKTLGEKRGSLVNGFLGGFVSSTAILLSTARHVKKSPSHWRSSLCSAFAAKLAALVELSLIVGLISTPLLLKVILPIGVGFVIGLVALIVCAYKLDNSHSTIELKSPLDWTGVFRLAFLLAAILSVILFTKEWLGDQATFFLAFLTGLFELHGTSLASATMYTHGQMSQETAGNIILIATGASLMAKVVLAWLIAGGAFARWLTFTFLTMTTVIVLMAWFT